MTEKGEQETFENGICQLLKIIDILLNCDFNKIIKELGINFKSPALS